MNEADWLEKVRCFLAPYQGRPWLVAVSGGCDSIVLYDILARFFPKQQRIVLHVNHCLQEKSADWASFVQQQAQKSGDVILTAHLTLADSSEATARAARYDFFKTAIASYDRPVLLMAHHRDDSDETALWRFVRGAPLAGILGIPEHALLQETPVLRPLVAVSRLQIESYAKNRALEWVQDPSNERQHYTRNFLRHSILQALHSRNLQNIAQSRQRLQDDYETLLEYQRPFIDNPQILPIGSYPLKSPSAWRSLIQQWLTYHQQPQPSYQALQSFVAQIISTYKNPLLRLEGDQQLAFYHHHIWRESLAWWSAPLPQKKIITDKSGSWGLFNYDNVSGPVVLRRLSKKDKLPFGPQAQQYWHQQLIPPWRRPFYPVVERDGVMLQYENLWALSKENAISFSCSLIS